MSEMPEPVVYSAVTDNALLKSSAEPGITGKNRLPATPQPLAFWGLPGTCEKSATEKRRVRPETPTERGAATGRLAPGAAAPCQPFTFTLRPPWKSGTPESRCTGRTAAAAISKSTAALLMVLEIRNCGFR